MRTNLGLVVGLALVAALGLTVAPAQDAAEFKITSVRLADGGATVALKFNSQTGTTYRVEISPSLGAGAWADAGVSAEGDGGERGFDIPTAGLACEPQDAGEVVAQLPLAQVGQNPQSQVDHLRHHAVYRLQLLKFEPCSVVVAVLPDDGFGCAQGLCEGVTASESCSPTGRSGRIPILVD